MSITVSVKNQTFTIPESGNRQWGEETTGWISAISLAVSDLTVTGDIKLISVSVANNQAATANVENLRFENSQTRHAIVEYGVYRITSGSEVSQAGQLFLTYKSSAATWEIEDHTVGDAGMVFTITTAGQIQYTSTNMAGTGYQGKMSFRGRAFPV